MDARTWLRENSYEDIADTIDEILLEWKLRGVKTRRNWWAILSGGVNGRQYTISGRVLPVLRAAQLRQGKPITKNAISRKKKEEFPTIQKQARWHEASESVATDE